MRILIKNPVQGGCTLLWVYLAATFLSFYYLLFTKTWNGDFIGRYIEMPICGLVLVFISTVIPSLYAYYVYKYFMYKNVELTPFPYNINLLRNITWLLFIFHILMLASGYGVMGTEGVKMSMNPLYIIRAILIKINPRIWGMTYILVSHNPKNIVITSLLFIVSSVLAHSLGGIFTLILVLLYKYKFFLMFIKRHFILAVLGFYLLPSFVLFSYNIRGNLRGSGNMVETEYFDVILGKLCGRISSISNNGYLLENILLISMDRDNIPALFYYYDALHYFGYRPSFVSTGNYVDQNIKRTNNPNTSTMTGVFGALVMSYAVSPNVLLINLFYVLFSIPLVFYLLKKMKFSNYLGVGLFITLAYSQSGDSSEIANAIYVLLFMWFVLSLFAKNRNEKKC